MTPPAARWWAAGRPVPPARIDSATFEQWLAPHWHAMTGLALRLAGPVDADDVVAEAVAAAWRLRDQFDQDRGTARTWLLTLTADHARRLHRRRPRIAIPTEITDGPAPEASRGDLDVARALRSLSHRQRLAVELFYYLGLPVNDIAAVMDCAPGTVKSTLADARTRLRTLLGENFR